MPWPRLQTPSIKRSLPLEVNVLSVKLTKLLFIIADESKKGIILGSKQNCLYDSLYCSMILSI